MGIIVVDVPVRIPAKVLDFQTDTLRSQDISILPGGDAANSSLVLSRLGKKTAAVRQVRRAVIACDIRRIARKTKAVRGSAPKDQKCATKKPPERVAL